MAGCLGTPDRAERHLAYRRRHVDRRGVRERLFPFGQRLRQHLGRIPQGNGYGSRPLRGRIGDPESLCQIAAGNLLSLYFTRRFRQPRIRDAGLYDQGRPALRTHRRVCDGPRLDPAVAGRGGRAGRVVGCHPLRMGRHRSTPRQWRPPGSRPRISPWHSGIISAATWSG